MIYFGKPWNNFIEKDCEQVPVPVGQKCFWCDEEIKEEDHGVVISFHPEHVECFIRQIAGSVEHQQGKCSCNGHVENSGNTRKEALEAMNLFNQRNSRYLCERCGGIGTQPEGKYYDNDLKTWVEKKAGICDDCNGEGYLGVYKR